jgi:hypothetical protein
VTITAPINGDDVDAQWASDITALVNTHDSLLATTPWVDFSGTVAWTATSAPAFGNATKVARYIQAVSSPLVIVHYKFTWGSTTTYGTGSWLFSLPVTASASMVNTAGSGGAFLLDNGVQEYEAGIKIDSTTTVKITIGGGSSSGSVTATAPFTWGSTDLVSALFSYYTN